MFLKDKPSSIYLPCHYPILSLSRANCANVQKRCFTDTAPSHKYLRLQIPGCN